MSNFYELSVLECTDINGGGPLLAAVVIVAACVVIFAVCVAVGYGLAVSLG